MELKPYVTSKGGVVILNGPFPMEQAKAAAALCEAAPGLLAAAEKALSFFNRTRAGREWTEQGGGEAKALADAIAKARTF